MKISKLLLWPKEIYFNEFIPDQAFMNMKDVMDVKKFLSPSRDPFFRLAVYLEK